MASEVKEDQNPEMKDEAAEEVKEDAEKMDEVSLDNSDEKVDTKDEKNESKPTDDTLKDKNDVKDSKAKKEPDSESKKKSKIEKESSDEGEETLGLLDRPVEVTGARARKKVERLEIAFTPKDKEKHEVPEGKGKKLGECPRIEFHIQKTTYQELKPLHKILFNRIGSSNEVKKNIRKFSGFPFEKDSVDFNRKKASIEKLAMKVLKEVCLVLDIERSGTKEEVVSRLLSFLMNPEDSGKKVPSKKKSSKDKSPKEKKKAPGKKAKTPKKSKTEMEESEEEEDKEDDDASGGDSSMGGSDEEMEVSDKGEASSDEEPKKKAKAKPKAVKAKKDEKVTKGQKRKHESDEDAGDDKPAKKAKMPTDEEISKLVKDILEKADLQEITMKKVIKQVSDSYPDFDLSDKKSFIKATIKSVIT